MKKIWPFIQTNINFLYTLLLVFILLSGLFSKEILKIVIWPSLLAMCLINFKDNFSRLVNGIIRLKFPGGELEITQTINPNDNSSEILRDHSEIVNNEEKNIKQDSTETLTVEKCIQHIAMQNIVIQFERIFNNIFESQISLLSKISGTEAGLSQIEINLYFNDIKNSAINVYYNWTSEKYILFLRSNNLIQINEKARFYMTEYGNAFLQYITSMNYQKFTGL